MKHKRHDRLLIPKPLLDASRDYRYQLTQAQRDLNPTCATYQAATAVMTAVDDLAETVTGDRGLFWAKDTDSFRQFRFPTRC